MKDQRNNYKMLLILVLLFLPTAFGKSIEAFGIQHEIKDEPSFESSEDLKYNVSLNEIN